MQIFQFRRAFFTILLMLTFLAGPVFSADPPTKDDIQATEVVGSLDKEGLLLIFQFGIYVPGWQDNLAGLDALKEKYGEKGLNIVAWHAQTAPPEDIKQGALAKGLKFSLVIGGSINNFDKKFENTCYFLLFGLDGKLAAQSSRLKDLEPKIQDQLKKVTNPILGAGVYKNISALAGRVKSMKNMGSLCADLQKIIEEEPEASEKRKEAEALLKRIDDYGSKRKAEVDNTLTISLMEGMKGLNDLVQFWGKSSAIGKDLDKTLQELKKSPKFAMEQKALAVCQDIETAYEKFNANPKKINRAKILAVIKKGDDIVAACPDTEGERKLKPLLDKLRALVPPEKNGDPLPEPPENEDDE